MHSSSSLLLLFFFVSDIEIYFDLSVARPFLFFEQRGLVRATERPTILLIGWKSRRQCDGYV